MSTKLERDRQIHSYERLLLWCLFAQALASEAERHDWIGCGLLGLVGGSILLVMGLSKLLDQIQNRRASEVEREK